MLAKVAAPVTLHVLLNEAAPAADRACTLVLPPPEDTAIPPADTASPPAEMVTAPAEQQTGGHEAVQLTYRWAACTLVLALTCHRRSSRLAHLIWQRLHLLTGRCWQ